MACKYLTLNLVHVVCIVFVSGFWWWLQWPLSTAVSDGACKWNLMLLILLCDLWFSILAQNPAALYYFTLSCNSINMYMPPCNPAYSIDCPCILELCILHSSYAWKSLLIEQTVLHICLVKLLPKLCWMVFTLWADCFLNCCLLSLFSWYACNSLFWSSLLSLERVSLFMSWSHESLLILF